MNQATRQLVALLLLGGVLFSVNIGGYDLWPADEPRFGEVAREMLDTGDWLVLRVNGEPYKEKPPLLFWAIAAVSAPFGDVTETTARIPSVVAALITLLCTYLLAARLYDRGTAWWSAVILMTGTRFWWQARTVQTDMILTACLSCALVAFWQWYDPPGGEARRVRWLVAFYGCVALAVYAKGPPGILFPILLIVAFFWRRRDERRRVHLLLGIGAVALAIAIWLIPARLAASAGATESADQAIAVNLFRQTIGRFVLGVSKLRGPWYYFMNLPVDWLPWSLFLPWTVAWTWRHRGEDERMRLLLSWTVPAFVFFSISLGKRAVYLLPIYPALAILVARGVLELAASERATWRKRTGYVWSGMLLALAGAPFYLLTTPHAESWDWGLLAFSLGATFLSVHGVHRAIMTDFGTIHKAIAGHFMIMTVLTVLFAFPAVDRHKSARPFCEPVRRLAESGESFRLYSVGFSREEYVFYSRHFHTPVFTDLSGLTLPENADLRALARIRKDIGDAVEDVQVGSLAEVTDGEIEQLREAIRDAVLEDERIEPDDAAAFQDALAAAVLEFATEFGEDSPAFLYVKQEDWRWILAFHPEMRQLEVIDMRSVGRRDVMLVANPPGARMLERTPAEATLPPQTQGSASSSLRG